MSLCFCLKRSDPQVEAKGCRLLRVTNLLRFMKYSVQLRFSGEAARIVGKEFQGNNTKFLEKFIRIKDT